MLAPQSGQIRLRIAEIKLIWALLTTANDAMLSLPSCGGSSPPNPQNLKHGPQGRFGEGAHWMEAAAHCFGFKRKSN
jgi:hypothetical protein